MSNMDNKVDIGDKSDKVTKHDLYDTLWSSRDFEISHLWQRSIFLATFLVLLFTIFFSTLDTIFFDKDEAEDKYNTVSVTSSYIGKSNTIVSVEEVENKDINILFSAMILDVLCLAGFSFSVLWLCMAKGSKYSYERHEAGIQTLYYNQHGFFDDDLNHQLFVDRYEKMWNGGDYKCTPHHGTLPLPDYSYSFRSFKGSSFSTSKINIMIGHIFIMAWVVMNFFQLFLLKGASCPLICIVILSLICVFLLYYFLYYLLCYLVQPSNYMKFSDYMKLARIYDRKIKEEDENQDLWVADFIAGGTKESRRVIDNLEKYMAKHEEPFRKEIVYRIKEESEPELKYIRMLRSDEKLWSIFETTLMQRNYIPEQFQGLWTLLDDNGAVLQGYEIKIDEEKIIGQSRVGVSYFIDLRNDFEYRAFIDNDWVRVRKADSYSQTIALKDFDRNATSIYLVAKPCDSKDVLYITLKLKEGNIKFSKYLEVMLMYDDRTEKNMYGKN